MGIVLLFVILSICFDALLAEIIFKVLLTAQPITNDGLSFAVPNVRKTVRFADDSGRA